MEGRKLTCLWFISKLVYIIGNGVQIYSLYSFMGPDYLSYGVDYLKDTFKGAGPRSLQLSMFPLVTMCDFEIRSLGKNLPYTVQCNLPINIYNAKIFLVIWYWLVVTVSLNLIVLTYQTILLAPLFRHRHIKNILKSLDIYDRNTDRRCVENFVFDYLRIDGYLTMRMIARNSTQIISAMVLNRLWTEYKYYTEEVPSGHPSPALPTWRNPTLHQQITKRHTYAHCNGHATVLPP